MKDVNLRIRRNKSTALPTERAMDVVMQPFNLRPRCNSRELQEQWHTRPPRSTHREVVDAAVRRPAHCHLSSC